ncbi:sn-glycerol-3-phosphate ABC transporter ATP-binding protein UgpC [Aeoliella sp. ICT_H6.2]|uniref:Sn-glycerol-3-phosphate ABC transporter ATP-binding protein UgpC n=1 Tax=Aeoliella straminimaris TaxID=2954799 RepID=A0A9X2FFP3_9BACT|nr:sn-glycerol-3-phosphate ABC transporter ATP-binding protein UgpC [Aeoliella straminimaris]
MASVSLHNVNKIYPGGIHAVHDFDLEVADGEFVVLVGPSGCGKSTTLRMIAGLEDVTSGDISIGERRVNAVPPGDRDIAMVFQNYALYPHMTVRQNMAFGLKMRRTPKAEVERRVAEAAQMLGVEAMLDRRPRELSGGQRQRVAVGRAIVRNPAVFLFDEPLSNLDAKLRAQMRTELAALHERLQATMIYVTHDQVEAMTLGDRLVLMKDGVVQQIGAPLEVYQYPTNQFVATFIGSPPMNLLKGNVKGGIFHGVDQHATWRLSAADDGPVVLGVRPEDLLPAEGDQSVLATVTPELIENLGHEVLVHFSLAGERLVARIPFGHATGIGQQLPLTVRAGSVRLFGDDEMGNALGSSTN